MSPRLSNETALRQLPWHLAGWAPQLEELDYALIESKQLPKDDEWTKAERVFVDFLPDEISHEDWKKLSPWAYKMTLLPPWVPQLAATSARTSKPMIISDRPGGKLQPLEYFDPQDPRWTLAGKPKAIDAQLLGKALDYSYIEDAKQLAKAMAAPGWVLANLNAPGEHAVYQTAAQYGMPVAYWQRAYTSPLRYFAGYTEPFDLCMDRTLRERMERAKNPKMPIRQAGPSYTRLEEVCEKLSYTALGLCTVAYGGNIERNANKKTLEHLLPTPMVEKGQHSPLLTVAVACARKLEKEMHSTQARTLGKRCWHTAVRLLVACDDIWARRALYLLAEEHPEPVYQAVEEVLKALQPATCFYELRAVWKNVARCLFQYPISRRPMWLKLLDSGTRGMFPADALEKNLGPSYYPVMLLQAMWGKSPQEYLPERWEEMPLLEDVQAAVAVEAMRNGHEARAQEALEKIKTSEQVSEWAAVLLAETALATASVGWAKCWELAQKKVGPVLAAWLANEMVWNHNADAQWRQKRQPCYAQMYQTLAAEGPAADSNVLALRLVIQALAGQVEPLRKEGLTNKFEGYMPMVIARTLWQLGCNKEAKEVMLKAPVESYDDVQLSMAAALDLALGLPAQGNAALEKIYASNRAFWQTGPLEYFPHEKCLFVGMIGKAVGDAEMAQKALDKLNLPTWADKKRQVELTGRVLNPEDLKPHLREWIIRTL